MFSFLARLEAHSHLMGQMMQRCGIDPARLAQERCGLTLAAVARTCMACGRTESCRKWLEAASADRKVVEPPSFCPNATRFRELQLH